MRAYSLFIDVLPDNPTKEDISSLSSDEAIVVLPSQSSTVTLHAINDFPSLNSPLLPLLGGVETSFASAQPASLAVDAHCWNIVGIPSVDDVFLPSE